MERFDKVAKEWDKKSHRERMLGIFEEYLKSVVRERDFESALDFGCGTGGLAFPFAEDFKKLYCVDTSLGMIDVLKEKMGSEHGHFVVRKVEDIDDIAAVQVDLIYTSMVMHHIKEIGRYVKGFKSLLNADGEVVVFDLLEEDGTFHGDGHEGIHHHGFSESYIVGLFKEAGFRSVDFEIVLEIERNTRNYPVFALRAKA